MYEWNDKYELGDIFIDSEHKVLFKLAAKITKQKGKIPPEKLKQYLMAIFEYTKFHFEHEERLMREIAWDGIEQHAQIHASIIAEMKDLIIDNPDTKTLQVKLGYFLNKWIVEHIAHEDPKFQAHLFANRGFMSLY